jgi:hypothetical protein
MAASSLKARPTKPGTNKAVRKEWLEVGAVSFTARLVGLPHVNTRQKESSIVHSAENTGGKAAERCSHIRGTLVRLPPPASCAPTAQLLAWTA